jgi:hypothetical protein
MGTLQCQDCEMPECPRSGLFNQISEENKIMSANFKHALQKREIHVRRGAVVQWNFLVGLRQGQLRRI